MLQICSMCLSRNRRLTPLRTLKRALDFLSWLHIKFDLKKDRVCWECSAMLVRIQRFQQQAVRAQHMLTLHRNTAQSIQSLESFSKLSTHTKTFFDESVLYEEVVKHESEDCHSYEYLDDDLAKVEKASVPNESEYLMSAIKQENNELTEEGNISEDEELAERKLSEHKDINKSSKEGDTFLHLTKYEEKFIVKRMTIEEMYKMRDLERKNDRYKSCPYKCIKCIKSFFSKEKYKTHVDNYHSKKRGSHVCSICSVRFSREAALQRHREGHLKLYACRACPFAHHRLRAASAHADAEHALNTYTCKFCDKAFISYRRLRYHTDKMHKARPTCQVCKKTFVTAHVLKIHTMAVHNKALLKECPHCGGKYRQLRAHMRTHAPPSGGEGAYCAECGRQFRNVYIYRSHLQLHANHRQPDALKYACTVCDAKFTNTTSRARHVSSKHTKVYEFACDTCGKGYHRRDRLQIHIQEKHEGISRPKDKICTYCGKAFKDAQVLKNHVRTHTGEKPYACELCPWRFTQRTALKTHVRALHLRQKSKVQQGG